MERELLSPQEYKIYTEILNNDHMNTWSGMLYCMPIMSEYILEKKCKTILELGSGFGQSTILFAILMKRIGGHLWSVEIRPDKFKDVKDKIDGYELTDYVTLINGDSTKIDWDKKCDLIFIDSSHERKQTKEELDKYSQWINVGGTIFLHDTTNQPPWGPDVWAGLGDFLIPQATAFNLKWRFTEYCVKHGLGKLELLR